jgi:hypothetical protein
MGAHDVFADGAKTDALKVVLTGNTAVDEQRDAPAAAASGLPPRHPIVSNGRSRGSIAGMTATTGFAAAAYVLVATRRQLAWGATSKESRGPLAGDELIATADVIATRAIVVRTSAEKV